MKVVIFGATGRTGRLLVDGALRAGHEVTVAARRPDQVDGLPDTVCVVRADAREAASVAAAVEEQDAVILAVSTPASKPAGLYSSAAWNVVTALADAPGTRLIVVSSGGVRRDDPALPAWYRRVLIPLFMSDLYDDMGRMEKIIEASEVDWTIVRASYLRNHPAKGRYRIDDGATPRRGWRLSRGDLATFVVDQLGGGEWSRKKPTLAE